MPRLTKAEILGDTPHTLARVIQNNTLQIFQEDGTQIIRHFHTDCLTFKPDGSIIFNTDGHKSSTTKLRINEHQDKIFIYQKHRVWYVTTRDSMFNDKYQSIVFADGMTWWPEDTLVVGIKIKNGILTGTGKAPNKKLIASIRKYCRDFVKQLPVNPPDGGDCWYCSILNGNEPNDHLLSHIEEKYYVPSLLARAMDNADAGKAYRWACFKITDINGNVSSDSWGYVIKNDYGKKQVERWLYNYLYRRLIDGATNNRLPSHGMY
jgi:hypothetical protein